MKIKPYTFLQFIVITILSFMFIVHAPSLQAAIEKTIQYQGYLKINSVVPVDGNHTFIFKIYPQATGSTACWDSGQMTIATQRGFFSAELAVGANCNGFNNANPYWMEITADTTVLSPRSKMLSSASSIVTSYLSGFSGTVVNVTGDLALSNSTAIRFLDSVVGAPNIAAGRRLNLFNAVSNNQYFLGLETNSMYLSSAQIFRWYSTDGTTYTEKMKLQNGTLSVSNKGLFNGAVWARDGYICGGGDVAEIVSKDEYPAGSVVCISPTSDPEYILCNSSYDETVAGVVSESPGLLLNGNQNQGLKLALNGRVKIKVTSENGKISKGDELVSSSTKGFAMKADISRVLPVQIIGKALEDFDQPTGEVLILVK